MGNWKIEMLVLDYLSFILFCYVSSRSEDSKLSIVIEKCSPFFFLTKSSLSSLGGKNFQFKNRYRRSIELEKEIEIMLFLRNKYSNFLHFCFRAKIEIQ